MGVSSRRAQSERGTQQRDAGRAQCKPPLAEAHSTRAPRWKHARVHKRNMKASAAARDARCGEATGRAGITRKGGHRNVRPSERPWQQPLAAGRLQGTSLHARRRAARQMRRPVFLLRRVRWHAPVRRPLKAHDGVTNLAFYTKPVTRGKRYRTNQQITGPDFRAIHPNAPRSHQQREGQASKLDRSNYDAALGQASPASHTD